MGKTASTGASLVLAVAALLVVSGCGGDSATSETASAPRSTSTSAAAPGGGPREESSSGQDTPASKQAQGKAAGGEEAAAGSKPGAGKQGPGITPPKGGRERAPTAAERAEATVASISLSSPALQPGPESVLTLPATYTCDGKDTWPLLEWAGVPPGTAELALIVLSLEPVDEALFVDWAVAGLDPGLEGLESGRLPKGAILGRNSFGQNGYSICPTAPSETYIFTLYALPERLGASRGFDPLALRKRILDISGNAGLLAVSYGRG